jgi:thiopurine S-methyltransferase
MELSYWESRWNKDKTGFHMPDGYPGLRECWPALEIQPNPRVLVPLCGKSVDLIFLEAEGAEVVGVEISEKAILSFFNEHDKHFETSKFAEFTIYKSGKIEFWQGDFMKYPQQDTGFDLIYDKAALVALPPGKRKTYADKLLTLTGARTSILLHHFIYPQDEMVGPPFSVERQEIDDYFSDQFTITQLKVNQIPSKQFLPFRRRGLKSPLSEHLLFLKPR